MGENNVDVAEPKPELIERDGLLVDARSKQRFLMAAEPFGLRAGFKCSGCQMVTDHALCTITMYQPDVEERVTKRIYGCQNCGKVSTK